MSDSPMKRPNDLFLESPVACKFPKSAVAAMKSGTIRLPAIHYIGHDVVGVCVRRTQCQELKAQMRLLAYE